MNATERQAWLSERRRGIGSSDAAAICGLSPYATPLHVYLDKIGQGLEHDSPEMRWGTRLEGAIAQAYSEETGRQCVVPEPKIFTSRHNEYMLCTPDRLGYSFDAPTVDVELKTARSEWAEVDGERQQVWGEPGTDAVPRQYLIQVQHQLAVLDDLPSADVAVLIAGSDFRIYTIHRSQPLIDELTKIEAGFWAMVQSRTPPAPDWTHPDTPKLLELLHRPIEGKAIDLDADALPLVDEYVRLGAEANEAEKKRKLAKAKLLEMSGDATLIRLPDGRKIQRKHVPGAEYTANRSEYWTFNVSKCPKAQEERVA